MYRRTLFFHDKTLQEMAAQLPQSVETLMQIHGVGAAKVEKYADVFLPIICASLSRTWTDGRKPINGGYCSLSYSVHYRKYGRIEY